MGRNKLKIFTEQDWKDADPIDRLHMHLLEPERWALTIEEDDRLEALRMVWSIMCKQATPRGRIKMISQHIHVTERTVHNYMRDAQLLFGEILQIDVVLELNLAYSRIMKLYEKASKAGDFETARRCQSDALDIMARIEAKQPKEAKKYPTITFTSDPAALQARNVGEYLDFEDDPTRVLEPQAVGVPTGH